MSIQDNRLKLNDIIKNNNLIDKELVKYFDIKDFKNHFNKFTEILFNDFAFSIDEIFIYYNMNNVNLSKVIMSMYIKAFEEVVDKYKTYNKNNLTYFNNQGKDLLSKDINQAVQQLKGFSIWFKRTYQNNINIIQRIKTEDSNVQTILNRLYDLGLFDFYNYVVRLETLSYDNLYNRRVQQISVYIIKYFFLTEVLLKVLLDVQGNTNTDSKGNRTIINNFSSYMNEQGLYMPNQYSPNIVKNYSCNTRNKLNPVLSTKVIQQMQNKLLKDMYDIVVSINKDSDKIQKQQLTFVNEKKTVSKNEDIINEMKKDKVRYNQVIRTLEDKDKNIKKNNTIDMIIMYLVILITVIYIFINIIKEVTNNNNLLIVNISLIVIILISKFYYLLK
tara:strand:+ start:342 stop:1505 length:1164 start_codon:yes stop_codon:yes gene_type:complete